MCLGCVVHARRHLLSQALREKMERDWAEIDALVDEIREDTEEMRRNLKELPVQIGILVFQQVLGTLLALCAGVWLAAHFHWFGL